MEQSCLSEFDLFVDTIRLDELCAAAAQCREDVSCSLGLHTIGGFNVVYELVFSDGVVWMARIPLPYNCFQPEEVTASYAATLKYLKRHSTIPVPTVLAYSLQSNPENKVNASYILMERLPGRPLPVLESPSLDIDLNDLAMAEKIHQQLTDVILELASLKFDKIGSLREDPEGNFIIGPYIDPNSTAYTQSRATAYSSLSDAHKGPFPSIHEWYEAMAQLNRKASLDDLENEEDGDETVADYEILTNLSNKIVVKEFDKGPFVINHNDLTVQNILVDEEFNITGILDFPGTIVPLPSLCIFPWLFSDNICGLVTDRDAYLNVFLGRDCQYPTSSLKSHEVRKHLMQSAHSRQKFELGLLGPYTSIVLPELFKELDGWLVDLDVERQKIANTLDWFKELVPPGPNGLYSWQNSRSS